MFVVIALHQRRRLKGKKSINRERTKDKRQRANGKGQTAKDKRQRQRTMAPRRKSQPLIVTRPLPEIPFSKGRQYRPRIGIDRLAQTVEAQSRCRRNVLRTMLSSPALHVPQSPIMWQRPTTSSSAAANAMAALEVEERPSTSSQRGEPEDTELRLDSAASVSTSVIMRALAASASLPALTSRRGTSRGSLHGSRAGSHAGSRAGSRAESNIQRRLSKGNIQQRSDGQDKNAFAPEERWTGFREGGLFKQSKPRAWHARGPQKTTLARKKALRRRKRRPRSRLNWLSLRIEADSGTITGMHSKCSLPADKLVSNNVL